MSRNKQVVLNLMVIVALLVSVTGVLPAGASVAVDVTEQAAVATGQAQAGDKSATGQETRDGFKSAVNAKQAKLQDLKAADAEFEAQGDQEVLVIVRLSEPDVVNYAGGISGFAPTAPVATGAKQFNANTPASKAYMSYLADKQAAFVASVQQFSPSAKAVANYQAAMNGVALKLPASDVAALRKLPEVKDIYKSEILKPLTDRGPQWISAPAVWSALGGQDKAGEGVVIGVIDTGAWMPNPITPTLPITQISPSFVSNASAYGGAYTFPFTSVTNLNFNKKFGVCDPVSPQASDGTFACNDKVIGGYWYNTGAIATATEFKSPLDNGGHGTHTASTAGGNRTTAIGVGATPPVVSGVAPRARIIAYKVCWEADPTNADDGGCSNADSLSAVNQAILDGVNTINFSISGGETPTTDPVELGFLNARTAGIFVSASAGNSGPAASTVAHLGPWVNTSAAMQDDRSFVSAVLVTSTFGTPPVGLNGVSATGPFTGRAVLAPKQNAADTYPSQCRLPYAAGTFQSTDIVVCRRGVNPRVEKSQIVKNGGAGGFILVNSADNQGLALDPYWLPGVHLERNATTYSTPGEGLVTYLLTAVPTNVVTITLTGGAPFTVTGDIMAAFSSRGPSGLNQIKPDNAAPGVAILAGVTPDPSETWTPPGNFYEFYNGTSMSSPHTAGAGALLKALHPDWTPAEIQSALMTGAVRILEEDGTTPADPFDQGAGRINLANSMAPGLLFNVTTAQYQAWIAGTATLESLNIPSFAQTQCLLNCSFNRTARNISGVTSTYTWTVVSAQPGLTVTLNQISYTVAPSATLNFTVNADVSALPDDGNYSSAYVVLHETTSGTEVAMPLSVVKVGSKFDKVLNISTPRNSGGATIAGIFGASYTGVTTTLYGLADPLTTVGTATGGDDQTAETNPLDPAFGWYLYTDTLPSGLGRYVVSTSNSSVSDLDMYLLYDFGGDGYDFADGDPNNPASDVIARSAGGTANELIDLLDLQSWSGEQFLIAVYNWSGEANATFNLNRWHVTPTAGSLALSGLPTSVTAGQVVTPVLTYNKAMTPGKTYYGLANIGITSSEAEIAQVLVNVNRTASEVTKSVSPATAKVGDVVTYTIVIQNQDALTRTFALTDVLPAGVTYVPGSLTGPATYDAGSNAVLISTVIPGLNKSSSYAVEDSLTVPGLAADSPYGGFADLTGAPNFFAVNNFGDDVSGNFNTLGCNFNFYDTALGSPTRIGFSSNGLFFPRGTQISAGGGTASPVYTVIPSAVITPDGFIAAFWDDLVASSIVPGVIITPSGYVAATTGSCPSRTGIVQIVNAWRYDDPTQLLNYELQFDSATPDDYWVLYGNISGTLTTGAVGIESPSGASGLQYLYNGAPPTHTLTTGRVLHYYRPQVAAPPVTVTFQATVNGGVAPIVNTAQYTVDVPYTTLMDVVATVNRILSKLFLPVIRA